MSSLPGTGGCYQVRVREVTGTGQHRNVLSESFMVVLCPFDVASSQTKKGK
jgi:hypothetical protein